MAISSTRSSRFDPINHRARAYLVRDRAAPIREARVLRVGQVGAVSGASTASANVEVGLSCVKRMPRMATWETTPYESEQAR